MSAGVSNSKGNESTKGRSTGTRKGEQYQTQNTQTSFDNTSRTTTEVPQWARLMNRNIAEGRAESERGSRDFLESLLTDPYDTSQPQNRFGAAINRLFDYNLARARGGTGQNGVARQGFREGAALAGAQDAAIGQGVGAATSLLQNANPMAALEWQRLIAPTTRQDSGTASSDTFGHTTTDEVTRGREQSATSMTGRNSGYGITICCFIFMEAYRGKKMPWYVRRSRDEFASGPRVEGYRKMAKHLVPMMRRSMLVRSMVEFAMVSPLTRFGKWVYGEGGHGWVFAPVVAFWFMLWALMGKTINFEPNE